MEIRLSFDSPSDCDSKKAKPRPLKGKSRLRNARKFVVIDIETTGLDCSHDKIIEISAIRYYSGQADDRFTSLVNPGVSLPSFIVSTTGITDEMLSAAPGIDDVLPQFLDFIGDGLLLGHNVNFDINFIYDTCLALGLPPISNDYIDTLRIARRRLPELSNHKLDTVAAALAVPGRDLHRSLNDCAMTAACYLELMKLPEPEHETSSVPRSVRKYERINLSDIQCTVDCVDSSNPLCGRNIVFTGTLSISRAEAAQRAKNSGAVLCGSVARSTDFLVVGKQDKSLVGDDGMSTKEERAHQLNSSGKADITFLTEAEFLSLTSFDFNLCYAGD